MGMSTDDEVARAFNRRTRCKRADSFSATSSHSSARA